MTISHPRMQVRHRCLVTAIVLVSRHRVTMPFNFVCICRLQVSDDAAWSVNGEPVWLQSDPPTPSRGKGMGHTAIKRYSRVKLSASAGHAGCSSYATLYCGNGDRDQVCSGPILRMLASTTREVREG